MVQLKRKTPFPRIFTSQTKPTKEKDTDSVGAVPLDQCVGGYFILAFSNICCAIYFISVSYKSY